MDASVPEPLIPTGERTLPGHDREQYFFARHEAVYRWISRRFWEHLEGAVVVDAGSGEGYGSDLLAGVGPRLVIALEYDEIACRHSARTYPAVRVAQANLAALPVQPRSVDVVVSLQVIEHLWDLRAFLHDVSSILRTGGVFIASTPNRPVFSPGLGRGDRPTNPFHVEEFDAEQLVDLMAHFDPSPTPGTTVDVLGLHHGERIIAWEAEHGSIMQAQITAITNDTWSSDLEEFVAGVTADDFVVTDKTERAHDLIVVGHRT